jgi:hypothetical protein
VRKGAVLGERLLELGGDLRLPPLPPESHDAAGLLEPALRPQADHLQDRVEPEYLHQDAVAGGVVDDVDEVAQQQQGVLRLNLLGEGVCRPVEIRYDLDRHLGG